MAEKVEIENQTHATGILSEWELRSAWDGWRAKTGSITSEEGMLQPAFVSCSGAAYRLNHSS